MNTAKLAGTFGIAMLASFGTALAAEEKQEILTVPNPETAADLCVDEAMQGYMKPFEDIMFSFGASVSMTFNKDAIVKACETETGVKSAIYGPMEEFAIQIGAIRLEMK